MTKYGKATINVAGIIPNPAYNDIVTAESVLVSFFIKISDIDQMKDDKRIRNPPMFIDTVGLKTIIVPKNAISKATIRLALIFSFKKIIANIVPKIGTVKFRAVTCDKVVRVSP